MKILFGVKGSLAASRHIIIGRTVVYIHSNIRKETIIDEAIGVTREEYIYDEIQYTRQEWEQILSEASAQMQDSLCEADENIENIMDALCEIDERLNGGGDGNE